MEANNTTILIVEPSTIIREGLTLVLTDYLCDIEIIHLNSFEKLEKYPGKKDVSLIIINPAVITNNVNNFNATLEKFPAVKIIGSISNYYDRSHSALFDDFIFINDDRKSICRIVKNNLTATPGKTAPKKNLTNRELDVLKLLVKGYSNRQIAEELFISIHTVVTHRKNITQKLSIKSTAGLAIYGVINNIIEIDDYLNDIQQ